MPMSIESSVDSRPDTSAMISVSRAPQITWE